MREAARKVPKCSLKLWRDAALRNGASLMPRLVVTTREGQSRTVQGEAGLSVMEVIRDHGFDELLALCGGCCSCATCHVHVVGNWLSKLLPMSEDEDELLESSDHRNNSSRLSCQIPFTEGLDGLAVTIAPED